VAGDGEIAGRGAAEGDGENAASPSAMLARLDLEGRIMAAYTSLRERWGIGDDRVVYFVPLLLILVVAGRSLAQFTNGYLFQVIGLGATNDLRVALYRRILFQSSSFYTRHPSGELVSRVGNDISVIQNAISTRLIDFFQQVPVAIGIVWYLLSMNLKLALIVFLVVPAIAYPIVRFGEGMRRTSRKSQERLADVSNLVAEAVRGQRVVKAFGMEEFELSRFRSATLRHLRAKLRAQLLVYASSPVIETLAVLGAGAFLVYAGLAVRKGELTGSSLVTFLAAVLMLYDPIRKLNKVNLVLQEALAAGQRVMDVMVEPNEVADAPDARLLPPMEEGIRFEDVAFAYEARPVLDGIDLVIPRGQVVALVGRSGAGKSTLVNLLPRFFDPSSGAVKIDGHDLRDVTLASLRDQIGIVTQDTVLFDDSVRNNIAYGRADLEQGAVEVAARAAFAHEFIVDMPEGYDTMIGERGVKVSGGQRQRLAIARAILADPRILILDEATSSLDSESEAQIQEGLRTLRAGRTTFVIAHRLSTIRSADRILVIEHGRIVEQGTHAELLARHGRYAELYAEQSLR
ncbi:MAG: ABC transporter ATP-binding protein/permease, partial [Holophagales bacterium]|nr:ABC transporter ATP-binding protein/permease [Holophagales bacterium]